MVAIVLISDTYLLGLSNPRVNNSDDNLCVTRFDNCSTVLRKLFRRFGF